MDSDQLKEKLRVMPNIKQKVRQSKNSDYIIIETTFTNIYPRSFWEKVMAGQDQSKEKDMGDLFDE